MQKDTYGWEIEGTPPQLRESGGKIEAFVDATYQLGELDVRQLEQIAAEVSAETQVHITPDCLVNATIRVLRCCRGQFSVVTKAVADQLCDPVRLENTSLQELLSDVIVIALRRQDRYYERVSPAIDRKIAQRRLTNAIHERMDTKRWLKEPGDERS